MNFARMALDDGAKVRFYNTGKHGLLRNSARQAKRELGLSGRQLKKLRKQIAREERAEAAACAASVATPTPLVPDHPFEKRIDP